MLQFSSVCFSHVFFNCLMFQFSSVVSIFECHCLVLQFSPMLAGCVGSYNQCMLIRQQNMFKLCANLIILPFKLCSHLIILLFTAQVACHGAAQTVDTGDISSATDASNAPRVCLSSSPWISCTQTSWSRFVARASTSRFQNPGCAHWASCRANARGALARRPESQRGHVKPAPLQM